MTDLEVQRWNVDFGVAKSMRYHAYRRSFWEMCDNWTKALSLVSGMGVVISLVGKDTKTATWLGVVVGIFSAADIILGFSNRVRLHDSLYRRFCRLSQDIADITQPDERTLAQWRRSRLEIEMDEPGALDWLERRCSAEEAKARGVDPQPAWVLPAWKIWLSQLAFWPSVVRR